MRTAMVMMPKSGNRAIVGFDEIGKLIDNCHIPWYIERSGKCPAYHRTLIARGEMETLPLVVWTAFRGLIGKRSV
jgi:hypothetical protein